MNKVVTFKSPSGDELVVLPAEEYRRLVDAVEMAEDIAAYLMQRADRKARAP